MALHPIAIVGRGRLGTALAEALRAAGLQILGPLGRGEALGAAEVVLLCVPDSQIENAAAAIDPGPIVAHCSGALTLAPLGRHERFSMHPLLSVTKQTTSFANAGCAIDASTPRARAACLQLVHALGMRPFELDDALRPLYHAAASVGAGYVVAVANLAERLIELAGVDRDYLIPLVRSAVDNWARSGASALTGPIARGDEATVRQHRAAIAEHSPESLSMWDALADATRALAARNETATESSSS
jgi:predicted short-subunit dehydrogenase-like oxidoreductase (DUF2520 family)